VRTKKVKDWVLEYNRSIDEWRTAERNDRYIEAIQQNHLFTEYVRWLHRTYKLFLRPTWTEANIEEDRDSDEGRHPYDVRTRVGYQMEHAPLRDRVVSFLAFVKMISICTLNPNIHLLMLLVQRAP
jgi:hypothetical protein